MSTKKLRVRLGLAAVAGMLLTQGCSSTTQISLDPNLGGETTRVETSQNSFGLPAPGLTNEERRLFERGDSFFTQNWVTAPASTDARDGLGPTFNAQSCSSCHGHDGRGFPLEDSGGDPRLGLLLRLSIPGVDPVTGKPNPDPNYGGQLQDRAILDVAPEATVSVEYQLIEGTYGDGTPYVLRKPTFSVENLAYGPLSDDIMISPRLAPQVMGVGLLEAIPETDIIANADPDDVDGDGISGRANIVWDPKLGSKNLGRFGWKAEVSTVENQVAEAFSGDIGITSVLAPEQNCPAAQKSCADSPNGGTPELTDERLGTVTFYNRTLSVPAMRDTESSTVLAGAERFHSMGCVSCHIDTFVTAADGLPVLSNQTIHPYTDLLVHDMGPELADDRPIFEADGQEWRTPPLWGLGLIDDVNGERYLLHDGRARTIEEAILWHGGEAETSAENFRTATKKERDEVIMFLEAL